MASWRHRHGPVEEDILVVRARNRLKNILRQQKFRSRWKVDEGDRVCSGNDDCQCDSCIVNELSGSQQKPFQRNSKKDGDKKTSLVCKMFERSVDLSQFPENTPLYPICKSWMQNKPKQESVNKVGGDDNLQVMKTDSHVQVFPKPKPLASRYDKFGNKISTFPLPPTLSTKDSKAILSRIISNPDVDEASLPSPATLFQNHMDRWVQVREHWRREGARREKCYEASYAIFRRLHQEVEDKT